MTEQPINVTYLLAVWGETYIRQFMDLSLRTLLAPGNIPALSAETNSTFLFLTSKRDRKFFANHPMFKRLERYVKVEFVIIDDLIFGGNYAATLTLAYERGMRHLRDRMLSTYFIYLVADYIMADGSLLNLLPYMRQDISGITAGNFQVIEEDLLESFKWRIDRTTGVLAMKPRELMAMSLPHLHPLTIANIANQNFSHSEHTNRLFWRTDARTLIGRFYLRHMLCIKPEIDNYIIGASCDYAYITEMCPSGNVAHISDSDEYCVIEMQPLAHEEHFIRSGPFKEKKLIKSLGEWTTRAHRDNAHYPVIYHIDDISPEAEAMVAESLNVVQRIERALPEVPEPVRGHPYWISCIEGVLESLLDVNNQQDYFKRGVFAGMIGSNTFEPPLGRISGDYHLLKKVRFRYGKDWRKTAIKWIHAFSGNEAKCKLWHREYAHSRAIMAAIRQAAARSDHFALIAFHPTGYAQWSLAEYGNRVLLQKAELFDVRPVEDIREKLAGASEAIILLPAAKAPKLGEILAKCAACLDGEKNVTVIFTERYFEAGSHFKTKLGMLASYCEAGLGVTINSIMTVTNPSRRWLDRFYQTQANRVMRPGLSLLQIIKRTIPMLLVVLTSIGYIFGNLLSIKRRYPHRGNPTCAILTLKLTGTNNIVLASEIRARDEMIEAG